MKNPVATIIIRGKGEFKLELYPQIAPNTVNSFIQLANSGYYDGLTFHRIVENFVLQGGSTDGTCREVSKFSIKGEFSENGVNNPLKHETGVISMARNDDFDSASAQFFIMHKPAKRLDGKYAAFGKMTEGYELLEELGHTPTDTEPGHDNPPLVPVYMESVRVELNDWNYTEPKRQIPPVL